MAPDCEGATLGAELPAPVHQGRRVLPARAAPALAWAESDEPGTTESRRLLPAADTRKHKPGLQAGLTLAVHSHYPHNNTALKHQKTRFQKRKEKLIEALKPPYFILTMILIMVGIHMFGSEELRARLQWLPGSWRREPWRLLTYGLLHATNAHIALNALVALAVGWRLEREQGWWRVASVWWCGVCAGALGAGALQPAVTVVGASAAVYALLTAHLPNVCLRFGYIPLWWFRPLSVVVLCVSEGGWELLHARDQYTAGGVVSGGGAGGGGEHVAWAAHVLGAAVGIPLAFIVFTGENSKKTHLIVCRIVSSLCLCAGAALAVVYYALYADGT